MTHPGIFAEQCERGLCPECLEWACICDQEENENPVIPVAEMNEAGDWVNNNTGEVITQRQAFEMDGYHADKCECRICKPNK